MLAGARVWGGTPCARGDGRHATAAGTRAPTTTATHLLVVVLVDDGGAEVEEDVEEEAAVYRELRSHVV
jgi:hypothetical protein